MIEFASVSKTYRSLFGKSVQAVDALSLQIVPGEVLGLAGPNGAGKSTLIALLLGFIRPTAGQVTIDGLAPRSYVERHGVGYLSELVAIKPGWTVDGALRRLATLAGVQATQVEARVTAVVQELGLDEYRRKQVKALSKGTLQRLGIAQALLRDERVFVFDEPTHGLDPVWMGNLRDMILTLRRPDRMILVASHNLDELERVSNRVAILHQGRLQRVVSTRQAAEALERATYRLTLIAGEEYVPAVFDGSAIPRADGEFDVSVEDTETLNQRLAALIARGGRVTSVVPTHSALEMQFRDAVGRTSE